MRAKLSLGLLVAAALCWMVVPAGAALVNASFENPQVPTGNVDYELTGNDLPGWTYVDSGTTYHPWVSHAVAAPEGAQYGEIYNYTYLYQISDITMEAGKTYTATVWAKDTRDLDEETVHLSLIAGDYTTVVATDSADANQAWVLTASFTCTEAEAGSLIGVMVGGPCSSGWESYDAVTLEMVPEPATMSLLAVGGIGVLIRRKQR